MLSHYLKLHLLFIMYFPVKDRYHVILEIVPELMIDILLQGTKELIR